jgi:hypothetical protein
MNVYSIGENSEGFVTAMTPSKDGKNYSYNAMIKHQNKYHYEPSIQQCLLKKVIHLLRPKPIVIPHAMEKMYRKPIDPNKSKFPIPDCFISSGDMIIANEKCAEFIHQHCPYFEIYQMRELHGNIYYALNYPDIESPFDFEKSLYYWPAEEFGRIEHINGEYLARVIHWVFKPDMLKERPLFYMHHLQYSQSTFITESFLNLLNSHFLVSHKVQLLCDNQTGIQYWHNQAYYEKELRDYQRIKGLQSLSIKKATPDVFQTQLFQGINILNSIEIIDLQDSANDIIGYLAQYLHKTPANKVGIEDQQALGILFGEQLHRQYNWSWLEKNGTWFITHPNHEDINPIELITDVLEKRMTAVQLSALFNTLGLTS